MMRHHHSKIFSACFPSNKSKNAVDIKPTLAHVEKSQRGPERPKNIYIRLKGKISLHFKEQVE
jgi:hypothetical protein